MVETEEAKEEFPNKYGGGPRGLGNNIKSI